MHVSYAISQTNSEHFKREEKEEEEEKEFHFFVDYYIPSIYASSLIYYKQHQ
jgi:hypothetical protein